MKYTPSKTFVVIAAFVALVVISVWYFYFLKKPVSELAPNLITDIIFAILIVQYIEYVGKQQRKRDNRARNRAVARSVQKYFHSILAIVSTIVRDGIVSSAATALPSIVEVKEAANSTSKKSSNVSKDFWTQPVPYIAYFMTKFTGSVDANVYPARTTQIYLAQRHQTLDANFKEILDIDSGDIPDRVIDALSEIQKSSIIWFASPIILGRPVRFGMWAEEELASLSKHLTIISDYFGEHFQYSKWSADQFFTDTIVNSFNERKITLAK